MEEKTTLVCKNKGIYPIHKIEQLWLLYYNDTLYAKGLITETERNRMRTKIHSRQTSCRK